MRGFLGIEGGGEEEDVVWGGVLESVGVEIGREVGIEKGVVYEVNGGWDDSLDL